MKQTATIHILGAGSIGLLWAAYLSLAGRQVTLITRDIHKSGHRQTVFLEKGSSKKQVDVALNTADKASHIDLLLVCTKAFDAFDAIASCAHRFNQETAIVLLQNGMGFQQTLIDKYPSQTLYVGISTEGALKTGAFALKHTGQGATFLGLIHGSKNNHKKICERLSCALSLQYQDQITAFQWQKLIINCVINPLTVYFDCQNGALADNPAAQLMKQALIDECRPLIHAQGLDSALHNIGEVIDDVIKKTANNSSSMREDVQQQKNTEIAFLNDYIVNLANTLGIACPTHQFLANYIQQREAQYESKNQHH
ncbi:MAG: 2-dehydropantoate 2-reductase [Pseudomonadales bacterium]|nr:2-dehydropantoate 2-reductase [Pseudomonadales bacterium]